MTESNLITVFFSSDTLSKNKVNKLAFYLFMLKKYRMLQIDGKIFNKKIFCGNQNSKS